MFTPHRREALRGGRQGGPEAQALAPGINRQDPTGVILVGSCLFPGQTPIRRSTRLSSGLALILALARSGMGAVLSIVGEAIPQRFEVGLGFSPTGGLALTPI